MSERLLRLVEQTVLDLPQGSAHNTLLEIGRRADAARIDLDWTVVLEHWWLLARLGVIALPGDHLAAGVNAPARVLTTGGRALLERGQDSPHYPQRYIAAVRARVAAPDEIVLSYLNEAVGAWTSGLYRSSAVMLGCACERLVLLLGEATTTVPGTWATSLTRLLDAARHGRPVFISQFFTHIRQALEWLAQNEQIPAAIEGTHDRTLTTVFEHARFLRNDSGHPTGRVVTAEEAESGLLLFPRFYEVVQGWIDFLRHKIAP